MSYEGCDGTSYKQQRESAHEKSRYLLPAIIIGNQVFRLLDNCHSSIPVAVRLYYIITVARDGQLFRSTKMKI